MNARVNGAVGRTDAAGARQVATAGSAGKETKAADAADAAAA